MRVVEIGTEKYTRVVASDEKEFNANHFYRVETTSKNVPVAIVGQVQFQKGSIKIPDILAAKPASAESAPTIIEAVAAGDAISEPGVKEE